MDTFNTPRYTLNIRMDSFDSTIDMLDITLDTLVATRNSLVHLETLEILRNVGLDPVNECGTLLKVHIF